MKTLPNLNSYPIPFRGHPSLHQEIGWHASDDGKILGIVIRDKVDNDYSWVMLAMDQHGQFYAEDVEASRPSEQAATDELLAAMRKAGAT